MQPHLGHLMVIVQTVRVKMSVCTFGRHSHCLMHILHDTNICEMIDGQGHVMWQGKGHI